MDLQTLRKYLRHLKDKLEDGDVVFWILATLSIFLFVFLLGRYALFLAYFLGALVMLPLVVCAGWFALQDLKSKGWSRWARMSSIFALELALLLCGLFVAPMIAGVVITTPALIVSTRITRRS